MRYFTPQFQIATMAPRQNRLVSKIGGLPWGLPARLWPSCCGRPQKLLAQLCHEPPMLDLGATGRVLHLFQCMQCLGIAEEVGRSALIVPRSAFGRGLAKIEGWDLPGQFGNALIGEAFVKSWEEHDDRIPAQRLPEFYDERALWAIQDEFSDIEWFDPRGMSKFGGTPRWTGNGPMGFPSPPYQFFFQMTGSLYMHGSPPDANVVGCSIIRQSYVNGRIISLGGVDPEPENAKVNAPWNISHDPAADHYWATFTNLGSDGTLYVFINREQNPPHVRWIWNR